jgi:pimeloyl-ACP methyl ester carboxylesterase
LHLRINHIQHHGLQLRYGDGRRLRDKSALLFIAGSGATLESVEPLAITLSRLRIGLLVLEPAGVGGSQRPRRPPRFSTYATQQAELLDELGLEQVAVMGHSWGGALAQQLARDHATRVVRLILACTSAGMVMMPGTPRALAGFLRPRLYRAEPDAPRPLPGVKLDLEGLAWQVLAGTGWTSIHWLHRLVMPTLVVAGKRDELVPLVNARLLAARIPNAQLRVLPDAGHLFPFTRPVQTAQIVAEFLA